MIAALIVVMFCMNIAFFCLKMKQRQSQPAQPVRPVVPVTPVYPDPQPEQQPPRQKTVPNFVTVEEFRKHSENSVYGDIMRHSREAPFGDQHGRATNAHETAHGIHSYLRNKYTRELKKKVNGFYALEGRGVVIEEPGIRKSDVNDFVPENLRSYRYKLYLQGQSAWDDTPLYIYDEWNAYVLGGMTNVDDVKNGRHKKGWTDGVSGCLGFSIYAVATCMAVKDKDPKFWDENLQFRNFTIWLLHRAKETYMIGRDMEEFQWEKQDKLHQEFLTSSEAEPMRRFIKEHLEGVWLDTEPKYHGNYSWLSHHVHGLTRECHHCRRH